MSIHHIKSTSNLSLIMLRSTFLKFTLHNSENPPSEKEIAEVMHELTEAIKDASRIEPLDDDNDFCTSECIYKLLIDYWNHDITFNNQMTVIDLIEHKYGVIAKQNFYKVVTLCPYGSKKYRTQPFKQMLI